jgi:hypothetical protein
VGVPPVRQAPARPGPPRPLICGLTLVLRRCRGASHYRDGRRTPTPTLAVGGMGPPRNQPPARHACAPCSWRPPRRGRPASSARPVASGVSSLEQVAGEVSQGDCAPAASPGSCQPASPGPWMHAGVDSVPVSLAVGFALLDPGAKFACTFLVWRCGGVGPSTGNAAGDGPKVRRTWPATRHNRCFDAACSALPACPRRGGGGPDLVCAGWRLLDFAGLDDTSPTVGREHSHRSPQHPERCSAGCHEGFAGAVSTEVSDATGRPRRSRHPRATPAGGT